MLVTVVSCGGCGYVGPVLPPSPQIPAGVTDLAVRESGETIVATFKAPARTTDGVAITQFSDIELRIFPPGQPPEFGKSYQVDTPPPSDRGDPQPKPLTHTLPAAEWIGQKISVAVRTSAKKATHFSAWSNTVVLEVVPPLKKPVVRAQGSGGGIILSWPADGGVRYRVQRQGPGDKQPVELGAVEGGQYVDASAAYGTDYRYVVTATKANAESPPSEAAAYAAVDKYPPAVPAGLTALAGPEAVGLAWQRDTEPDLQGYYIYRSINNGSYERVGGLITLPAYSDHEVEHGRTYTYKVSSIDKAGNESAPSSGVEAQF